MVRPCEEGITVTIKGRLFVLVWDDDFTAYSTCEICALRNEVCKTYRETNLIALCAFLVQEPGTYFVEKNVR